MDLRGEDMHSNLSSLNNFSFSVDKHPLFQNQNHSSNSIKSIAYPNVY